MSNTDLSDRELEILKLKAAGFQHKEIARKLGVHISTIKNYAYNILCKLAVCNSVAAVVVAIRDGDIDPDEIEIARRDSNA
jgi:DNA-binding NarL/FixJ family response regulator